MLKEYKNGMWAKIGRQKFEGSSVVMRTMLVPLRVGRDLEHPTFNKSDKLDQEL